MKNVTICTHAISGKCPWCGQEKHLVASKFEVVFSSDDLGFHATMSKIVDGEEVASASADCDITEGDLGLSTIEFLFKELMCD